MAAFVYRGRTALDIHLRILDYAVTADTYETVLNALGGGIRKSVGRIDSDPDDDGVVDYETDIIENMLGAAFVVCQAQVNAVLEAALKVPQQTRKKHEIRKLGPSFDTSYSKVEILWALANYFKHRDEWGTKWSNAGSREKLTVDAIKAAGLSADSPGGNLRTGAEALGNASPYSDVEIFYRVVREWSEKVREDIRIRTQVGR